MIKEWARGGEGRGGGPARSEQPGCFKCGGGWVVLGVDAWREGRRARGAYTAVRGPPPPCAPASSKGGTENNSSDGGA